MVNALAEAEEFIEMVPRDYLNFTVETSDWSLQGTPDYPDYPYIATISIADATADDLPEVVPSYAAISDGLLCPFTAVEAGGVKIYASAVPANDYTIERVTLRKENTQS